jgi:hypothetical protein
MGFAVSRPEHPHAEVAYEMQLLALESLPLLALRGDAADGFRRLPTVCEDNGCEYR